MKKLKLLLPFLAFVSYLAKTIVVPATIPDAIILCGLVAYIIISQLTLKDSTLEKYDASFKELKEKQEAIEAKLVLLQSSNSAMKASIGMRQVMGAKI